MDPNLITVVTDFINRVGFPIFVAVWVLVKSSADSQKMVEALNRLENAILALQIKLTGQVPTDEK